MLCGKGTALLALRKPLSENLTEMHFKRTKFRGIDNDISEQRVHLCRVWKVTVVQLEF